MKTPRNAACNCGSGRKFKRCCGKGPVQSISDQVRLIGMAGLEYDPQARRDGLLALQALDGRDSLDEGDRKIVQIGLVEALQRNGDHVTALERLQDLSRVHPQDPFIPYLAGKSLERLGDFDQARALYEEVLPELRAIFDDVGYAFTLVEYGRACSRLDDSEKAIEVWTEAAGYLEGIPRELEHYARALSNIAGEQLKSLDPEIRSLGERTMESAIDLKAQVGDIEGLSNNYSRLSMYCLEHERFERSIAFARKDVRFARLVGDDQGLAASLSNLAIIYLKMLQLTSARKLLDEAREIGERLRQEPIVENVKNILGAVEEAGRVAGRNRRRVNATAICSCNSGKEYQYCCGRADFEPEAALPGFAGFSQDIAALQLETRESKPTLDWLDHVLRNTEESKRRFSWSELVGHDGWFEAFELTDMANLHLFAARSLADRPEAGAANFEGPLSACILSVCAAEAFINTLCYFVSDAVAKDGSLEFASSLPARLVEDGAAYQRQTELTQKWVDLGTALCGPQWRRQDIWAAFLTLVAVRNELVHFKAIAYEQVFPRPRVLPEILRKIPESVELRDVPHSWPTRLLTPSFANWCVSSVEQLIGTFKDEWARIRSMADASANEQAG